MYFMVHWSHSARTRGSVLKPHVGTGLCCCSVLEQCTKSNDLSGSNLKTPCSIWHPDFSRSPCRDIVGFDFLGFLCKRRPAPLSFICGFCSVGVCGNFQKVFIIKRARNYTVKKIYMYIKPVEHSNI